MRSTAELSLEQAPPVSLPLRFFLTAPLFGMAAGLLLLVAGPDVFLHRWAPLTLALTHLLTLGVITMVMCGAALQILPVLAGVATPFARLVGSVTHLSLILGTLCLVWGFIADASSFLFLAMGMLSLAFSVFIGALVVAFLRVKVKNPSVRSMQAALLSLFVTGSLGLCLTSILSTSATSSDVAMLTDMHFAWGLLGWVGLLIVGVAFQVIPLFQMSPEYSKRIQVSLIPIMLSLLISWTLAYGFQWPLLRGLSEFFLVSGFVGFALVTLYLLGKRRRRVADVSLLFWRTFAVSVLAIALLWLTDNFLLPGYSAAYPFLLGVGLIGGVGITVINGMLYKIAPFLCWFHLQHRQMSSMQFGMVEIPHMKALLSDNWAHKQYWLHLVMLALAIASAISPALFARPLGFALLLSFALLWRNLLGVALRYRSASKQLAEASGSPKINAYDSP
jgi:hypothetical protein